MSDPNEFLDAPDLDHIGDCEVYAAIGADRRRVHVTQGDDAHLELNVEAAGAFRDWLNRVLP